MLRTVELPLWLLLLILGFAGVTFASHFLFPSVRWFLRRRMERAVARLNARLARPIEPFKLARRHDTIQRLVYDRDVLAAVADHARTEGIPQEVAHELARHYAREIVPRFSATAYFGIAIRAARACARLLYDVRIAHADDGLRKLSPEATVVFVMNHRSNLDYVLVTYLVARRTALSYAVGEWARIWPLAPLIRAMGAYFIRRKAPDGLYRRVLARYVTMATAAGVTQAVFPEGGLSLDGGLKPAKLGIVSYIVDGHRESGRDVVFVPVALNYDRVLEDRVLTGAAARGERRFRASVPVMARFSLRLAGRMLTGRFRKFGTAAVGFGAPLSLAAFADGKGEGLVEALGAELMTRIAAVVPRLPVPVVAAELLAAGAPLTPDDLAGRIARRHGTAAGDAAVAAARGVATLALRGIVAETATGSAAVPDHQDLLRYYAASIGHLRNAPAASPGGKDANSESVAT